jgi:hypothetical protein
MRRNNKKINKIKIYNKGEDYRNLSEILQKEMDI